MLSSGILSAVSKPLLLGMLLFVASGAAFAQERGNHAPRTVLTRPDAVDEKDTLKDFHEALAVQATGQQIAEFQALRKKTEGAKAGIQKFLQPVKEISLTAANNSELDQSLESARSATRNFIDGFSDKQKSGLKEHVRLLDRADTLLGDEERKLDQALKMSPVPSASVSEYAAGLDKAIDDFSSQQLALAREMSIVLATANDVIFNLPAVKNALTIAAQPVQVTVSGQLQQTAAEAGQRTFRLELIGDLTDFQQKITQLLQVSVNTENSCGERLAVRQAMLMPSAPASMLNLQLHYERWACFRIAGQTTSNELAENDGNVEIRLLPSIVSSGDLQLKSEFGRIDSTGMMADALRSGDLGSVLCAKVERAFLSALLTTTDLKTALPHSIEGSATLESAKFEDEGAGALGIMLQGQVHISDEQAQSLASQLNQRLSAQGNAAAP